MRLICPNCGAQYEVDGTVIPEAGRDVQCSNCGHTWFQKQAVQEAEPETQQTVPKDSKADDRPDAAAASEKDATEIVAETQEKPVSEDPDVTKEKPEEADPELAEPQRQPLDQSAEKVLREEAELETAQRSPENTALDEKPAEVPQKASAERPPLGQMSNSDGADFDNKRKDLLPDIEEINSTLVPSSAENEVVDDTTEELRRRSGFRRGFIAAVAVFSVMALTYVFAPDIADAVPGSANSLAAYVDWINGIRIAVDGMMLGAVEKLTGILAQINGDQAG